MQIMEYIERFIVWVFTRNIRLFALFGVPIFVHGSLLFLVELALLIAVLNCLFGSGEGAETAKAFLTYIANVFLVFGCVTLHEFGHILMARAFGVKAQKVILCAVGGVALLETTLFKRPIQTFLVAVAGPMVNVVLLAIWQVLPDFFQWEVFLNINKMLILFNLLPIYPMDGGRVVHAICQWLARNDEIPHLRALKWTRSVATVAAICSSAAFTYFNDIWATIIIWLVYFLADNDTSTKEAAESWLKETLADMRVATKGDEQLFKTGLIKLHVTTRLLKDDPNTENISARRDDFYQRLYEAIESNSWYRQRWAEQYEACKSDLERFRVVEKWVFRDADILQVSA